MKLFVSTATLALLILVGSMAPLSAAEPAAAATVNPAPEALSLVFTAAALPGRCPNFFCPIYPEYGCSCDWIECPDGSIVCGQWNGTLAASAPASPAAPVSPF
jgi:hypothetical protein